MYAWALGERLVQLAEIRRRESANDQAHRQHPDRHGRRAYGSGRARHAARTQRTDRLPSRGCGRVPTALDRESRSHRGAQAHRRGSEHGFPGWAPDGNRIAFDSDRSDPDPTDDALVNDVYTMRADGGGVTKLTDSVGFSGDPAYSPDGALIAFDADRGVMSGDPGWTQANADLSVYVM